LLSIRQRILWRSLEDILPAMPVMFLSLKLILAGLLAIAGLLMLVRIKERPIHTAKKCGYWHRDFQGQSYVVNLWYTIPITALAGLAAGAVGISCGSFKVPLMVLLCGVPMRIAVGTSSAMVAATAVMGFIGHATQGHFDPTGAIPFAVIAVLGGLLGGKFALKTKPEKLKKIWSPSARNHLLLRLVWR